jgi:hypothetical protein
MSNPNTPPHQEPAKAGPAPFTDALELIAADPAAWAETCSLSEVRDTGATGASVGPFDLHPLDSFEQRLRAAMPVPLRLHMRIKRRGNFGFHGVYLIELSALSTAGRQDAPPSPPSPLSFAPQPPGSSVVPSNPFDGALSVLSVVGALGDRIEAQAEKIAARVVAPAAAPPVDVAAILAAGRQLGEKENPWLAALDKAAGFLVPLATGVADAIGARAALTRAQAAALAAHTAATDPVAAEPEATDPVAAEPEATDPVADEPEPAPLRTDPVADEPEPAPRRRRAN